jgi:predicted outer membrane repeat protein
MYSTGSLCTTDGGYGSGWELSYGMFQDYAVGNIDATQACCACGGGSVVGDSYPGEISVSDKTCVIHGNGKTLDAGGGGRIFKVTGTGSSLEVHNLALINGAGLGENGGAIYIKDGTLVIRDSTFNANSVASSNGLGGALYFLRADVRIYTSIFESNTAGNGGAIYANQADVKIYTSIFESNAVTGDPYEGGAIAADDGNLKIYDTTFQSNICHVVYIPSAYCCMGYGGAIHARGTDVKIYTSTFESNSAHDLGSGGGIYDPGFGGGIYGQLGTTTIALEQVTFSANTPGEVSCS